METPIRTKSIEAFGNVNIVHRFRFSLYILTSYATRQRLEHPLHIRDAGRVEAERLVERVRTLPSQKVGMRCGKRCGPGGVRALCVAATQSACTGRARLKAGGARARAERTQNMEYMVVTLDVSKLSGWLNTRAPCRVKRWACDGGRGTAREA